jgi:uncharacterized lipoprotein
MNIARALFLSCILLVNGCAYTPQKVLIDPDCNISLSNIGKGKSVAVKVVDERPKETIGHRGAGYLTGAEITTDQDISSVIYDEVEGALERKGFKAVSFTEEEKRFLKIEVRLIDYSTSAGFWHGYLHTKSAMKVFAKNGVDSYEKLYREENEENLWFVPGDEHNVELINIIVGDVIEQMFSDSQLLNLLTRE